MKRVVFGLVAVAALMFVPVAAEAGDYHHHRHHGGGQRWDVGYRGGWGGPNYYRRAPRVVYRPPVTVYRPIYPAYPAYGPNTSFYYNGPNASFGFGF
jgi:hypothetical protein